MVQPIKSQPDRALTNDPAYYCVQTEKLSQQTGSTNIEDFLKYIERFPNGYIYSVSQAEVRSG